jgi:peptide deformylase
VILKVHHLPDPVLKNPALPADFKDRRVQTLIDDMFATMAHHPRCVGLAAPQVGHSLRVIVVDASRVDKPGSSHGRLALLNPAITHRGKPRLLREGCLSIPDYTGNVLRDDNVHVEGLNREGHAVKIAAHGFEAVVFQHEVDHLDGRLFLDRVTSLETDVFRRKSYG